MGESISKKITEHKHNGIITDYVRVSMNNGAVYVGVLLHIGKSFHINNTVRFIKVNTMTAGIIDIFIGDIQDIEFAVFEKGCDGKTEKEEWKGVNYTLLGNARVTMEDGTIYDGKFAIKDDQRGTYSIITDKEIIELSGYGIQELKYTPSKGRQIYDTFSVNEKVISRAGCGWKLDNEHSPVIVAYSKVNYTPINKKEMKTFGIKFKENWPNAAVEADRLDMTDKDCYIFRAGQEIVSIVDRSCVQSIMIKPEKEQSPTQKEKATETR